VVVTGRDAARGAAAVGQLRRRAGHDDIRFVSGDHATVAGNLNLAARLSRELDRLEVLVNNVGAMPSSQRRETEDGLRGHTCIWPEGAVGG
jgi:NAD(P)-dependent dehydrogenase (short-subunit alcohol dehydrogenase family)